MTPQPIPGGETAREIGLAPPPAAAGRWRYLFGLFRRYWLSADWKFAWFGLVVLLAYQFGNVYVMVAGNRWQQAFFDSVEQRQAARFVPLLLAFAAIMAAQVAVTLIYNWMSMALGIRWRTVLTAHYLDRWMQGDRYAEIERLRLIDNPDQRISEDIIRLTTGAEANGHALLTIVFGVLGMVVGSVSFMLILLETAEPIRLTLFGHALAIPGSTVWYALAYSLVGTLVITRIGRPFVRALMRQQHREADFRANMIHVRRNAGQIGFSGAVPRERAALDTSYAQVRGNFGSVIRSLIGLNLGQGIYERIGSILPLFLMVPRYFAGAISFGQVMGARDAFQSLTSQLSFIVQAYSWIGMQIACLDRLRALDAVMDLDRPRGIGFFLTNDGATALRADGLRVHRPHGAPLLDLGDWTVRRGERWVVQGPSGTGKSTLLRAIVGLWPDGAGRVMRDAGLAAMMVPQRLYLPLGTLKGAICFPDGDGDHGDDAILAMLDRVGLSAHGEQLHAVRHWQEELSPGEQQRVALARILLHRPDLLILDEATSALDPDNARRFHEEILAMRPDLTLVSVVHDERLARYHTHRLTLVDGRGEGGML